MIETDQMTARSGIDIRPTGARLRYGGVVAAVVSPCSSVGVVDPAAMSRLCRALVENGCNGVFVAGSTGESSVLDEADRRSLTVAAAEGVESAGLVYVGVSGLGRKQTVHYAKHAAADGAHVAVVMSPFLLRFSQEEVMQYLWAIADESSIPIAIYHHPRMSTQLDVETVAIVADHPNCVAVKDTSVDVSRIRGLIAATDRRVAIMQGNESLIHDSLATGAAGMVTALAGVVPEWHQSLWQADRAGDLNTAAALQRKLTRLWKMFRMEPVRQSISAFSYSIKLALQRRGWLDDLSGLMGGFQPSDEFVRLIQDHLADAGVPTEADSTRRIDHPHVPKVKQHVGT